MDSLLFKLSSAKNYRSVTIMKVAWTLPVSENPQFDRHFFQVDPQKNSIHQKSPAPPSS
jgi:hypothetical protein